MNPAVYGHGNVKRERPLKVSRRIYPEEDAMQTDSVRKMSGDDGDDGDVPPPDIYQNNTWLLWGRASQSSFGK
jgi:hypothetical protein